MPAGSGHGFVQLVSCGLRAALFYDLLSAPGAEEQDFAACGPRPGSALDPRFFEKNRVKLSSLWQSNEKPFLICANC